MQKTRRQFSIEIIRCDGFIAMSSGAQALYFQLMGSCDDEGFTSQVEICKFLAHASDNDLQELIKRRFVYVIENDGVKVAVIKHWRLNNYFREGQAKPSTFAERAQVYVKPNGNYTLDSSEGQPLVQKRQWSLSKTQTPSQKPHAGTPARSESLAQCAGAPRSNPIQGTNVPNTSNTPSKDSVLHNPIQSNPTQTNEDSNHEEDYSWLPPDE